MAAYEYLPPHAGPSKKFSKPGPLHTWEVELHYGGETIRRKVQAESERKALNRVIAEISRSTGTLINRVFQRVFAEKKYTVTKANSFLTRAASLVTPEHDMERISKLPGVDSVTLYERNGNAVVYRAELRLGNTLAEVREVTGYIQNLFGSRLLSSGATQIKKPNGTTANVVEARVSLLTIVHE